MSKYFLVPDLHGELDMAAGLLTQEGLLNSFYERTREDVTVIQMGDMMNCVASSVVDDNRCLDHEGWFDILLMGNHEHPYFGGPAFAGFYHDVMINHRIKKLDAIDRYKVAVNCDGILVTHAGLVTHYANLYNFFEVDECASILNDLWQRDKTHEIFSAIGWERRGWSKWGSVLWADWTQYKTPKLKQIVGHSVGQGVRVQFEGKQVERHTDLENIDLDYFKWEAICIDLGAGKHSTSIVGAWIEDGNVKLVEYKNE